MKSSVKILLILLLISTTRADRWDITLADGSAIINIQDRWLVGTTLFLALEDTLEAVEVADVDYIVEYRRVKAPFNLRRAWSFTQTFAIGGALVGTLVGSRGLDDQTEKMQAVMKSSATLGLAAGGTGFVIGGILGSSRIHKVNYSLRDFPNARKYRRIAHIIAREERNGD